MTGNPVHLDIVRDAEPGEDGEIDVVRDRPVSYDPERRLYDWRTVIRDEPVAVPNPDSRVRPGSHDPFALLGTL